MRLVVHDVQDGGQLFEATPGGGHVGLRVQERDFLDEAGGRLLRRHDHPGLGHRHQQQSGTVGGNHRRGQSGLELHSAVEAVDETLLVGVGSDVLQALPAIGRGHQVLPVERSQHVVHAFRIVRAAGALENEGGRRALETHRLIAARLATLESETAFAPREDLEQLGLHLQDQGARKIVR